MVDILNWCLVCTARPGGKRLKLGQKLFSEIIWVRTKTFQYNSDAEMKKSKKFPTHIPLMFIVFSAVVVRGGLRQQRGTQTVWRVG